MKALFVLPSLLSVAFTTSALLHPETAMGAAVAVAALSALLGGLTWMKTHQPIPPEAVSEKLAQEVADLKSAVNAMKLGRSLGRG